MIKCKMQRQILLAGLWGNAKDARRRLALSTTDLERLAMVPAGSALAIEEGRDTDLTLSDLERLALTLGLTDEGKRRSR